MKCISCDGNGCGECRDKGTLTIECCPLEYITEDAWEVIRYAELYEKGLPPVAGGALDQARCFVEAASFIFSEKTYWDNKLGVLK